MFCIKNKAFNFITPIALYDALPILTLDMLQHMTAERVRPTGRMLKCNTCRQHGLYLAWRTCVKMHGDFLIVEYDDD